MVSSLASLLTGRVVDPKVAMTGEITLRGKILPVGGIKEKVLAAHGAGIKTMILPRHNERDLEEVPADLEKSARRRSCRYREGGPRFEPWSLCQCRRSQAPSAKLVSPFDNTTSAGLSSPYHGQRPSVLSPM